MTGTLRPDPVISAFLAARGLVAEGQAASYTPLTGGVSSDIWLVEAEPRPFCVKRALPRLRVAAEWIVPTRRNAFEVRWLRDVAAILPGAVPAVLADDPEQGLLVLEYLPAADHPLWKGRLLAGQADRGVAAAVGRSLGLIHAAFARQPGAVVAYDSAAIFHALRLEPYLLATARAHPALAGALERLVAVTEATRLSVLHGDVSPKNILIGPKGPVFLDAECATWGDPAFDAAFCLNHLLLKCIAVPAVAPSFLACFDALAEGWLSLVDWEDRNRAEARAAALLPALLLARIDGKSPVEYITADSEREAVRRVAIPLIGKPVSRLAAIRAAWADGLAHNDRAAGNREDPT